MRTPWLEHFMSQTRIAVHVSRRDFILRTTTVTLMVIIIYLLGATQTAIILAALIMVLEAFTLILIKLMTNASHRRSVMLGFMFYTTNTAAMLPYLAFSSILISDTTIAVVLAGYVWLFGIYVYISNSYAMLPIYNWTLMTPAFLVAFANFFLSANHTIGPSPAQHWVLPAGMMCVYIARTVQTMHNGKDTQAALAQAQMDAAVRMKDLEFLSNHDKLTGLKNRAAFDRELAAMTHSGIAIFIIDLDDFKPINDSYSHMAGDTVLISVAHGLQRIAGPDAIVARLGGDEFAAVIPNIGTADAALRMGHYMNRMLAAPVQFEEKLLRVHMSIGIALATDTLKSPTELCAAADQAMYHAKSRHDQKVTVYERRLFPPRHTLEDRNMLYDAIHAQHIRPSYKVKACLNNGRILGFEALAQWTHPTKGLLDAPSFLPQIKEFGLQSDLMMHLGRQVLSDMNDIHTAGLDPGQVSINVPEAALATVSGRTELTAILKDYPHLQKHLTLEVTEAVLSGRGAEIIGRSFAHFKAQGLRISLDGFGSGFASFQHLRQFAFDELKLSSDFIHALGQDHATDVLVGGFLNISRGLGVQVIADGIETDQQLQHLKAKGCEIGQGALFGPSMTASQAISLLKSGHIKPSLPITSAA